MIAFVLLSLCLTSSFLKYAITLGDDPFWEAVDLWYGATGDGGWYDPGQVTMRGRASVIMMDSNVMMKVRMTNGGFGVVAGCRLCY